MLAHRGGRALAPENTIAAFDRGLSLGADGLELDVHLSRDGIAVVHHDPTLERTTNLTGALADRTASELAQADAGYHCRPADGFPFRGQHIGIPSLDDVLRRYPDVPIVIEMKDNTLELARTTIDSVRRSGAVERVCLGSFGLRVLREARRLAPEVATSAAREEVRWALYRSWCRWPVRPSSRTGYDGYQVPERSGWTRVVSRQFVDDAHGAGLGVQVWTVDREEDATRLLEWGVDGLITDRPDVIVPLVRYRSTRPERRA